MGRLTSDERRRIFLAQQQSAGEVLAPVRAPLLSLSNTLLHGRGGGASRR